MKFSFAAQVFEKIEKVSSRTTITHLLAELFTNADPTEAAMIAYLSLGELQPPYLGTKFNFAEKSMYKVLGRLCNQPASVIEEQVKKLGDVGLILEHNQWACRDEQQLSVMEVVASLNAFINLAGTGSNGAKEDLIVNLLQSLDAISCKYVIRIIVGKLRLGFSDMTLLDAFSWMAAGNKSLRPELENVYNITADIGYLIRIFKIGGAPALETIQIIPGIPIRPAAAERLNDAAAIVKKLGPCIAQPKLDGFRLQVHKWTDNETTMIRFFSRNLQDMSGIFPELYKTVREIPCLSFVAEGEAIAYDPVTGTFLPFQETAKRKRKHDVEQTAEDFPLKLYLFDLLYKDGISYLNTTHTHRREELLRLVSKPMSTPLKPLIPVDKLKANGKSAKVDISGQKNIFTELVCEPSQQFDPQIITAIDEEKIEKAEELELYFNKNISAGLEGLVVKKPTATYQPGKRNFNWIKLKRHQSGELLDSVDCVILGYYVGAGKRAAFGIGALLVGVFNKKNDCFETIAKVGTGFTDIEWQEVKIKCDALIAPEQPHNVICAKELTPDAWVFPEIVCQIVADEITLSPLHKAGAHKESLGYALRFPRMVGYRPDKSATEATTVDEVKELFSLQFARSK